MQKVKRIEDPDLVEYVKTLPCVACGGQGFDPHHVTSRGAGGGDTPINLMPLCRRCHTEWHAIGPVRMIQQYYGVKLWLELAGRTDVLEKWKRLKTEEV